MQTTIQERERPVRIILAVQGARAFVYGFGSVLIGVELATSGAGAAVAGGVFTAMLVGMAIGSLSVSRLADAVGHRRLYIALLLLMGLCGGVFALTSWWPLLVIAALTGTLSTDPNESGPITTLEQAMLSGTDPAARARVFGRYNAVAYLAGSLGALAAAVPPALRGATAAAPADRWWLLVFPVAGLLSAAAATRLSAVTERRPAGARRGLRRSRSTVRMLAALFAMDAFGGGLVVQSFMVFWLQRRFGASTEILAAAFFGVGILQALSSIAAARLSRHIGLLNTMVFTHLPSNVLLALIPLMPSLPLALAALLARSALSQMDVPTRQAYVAAMVDPAEWTAAAAYTNTARYAIRPIGPLTGGALMQLFIAAPFLVAGAIKVVYDAALFLRFRSVEIETPSGGG